MNHTAPSSQCRVAAFTLIEVLVVVAIIALLVSILLPAMSRARMQAKLVMCEANMREMGNAMNMYILEAKDKLPGPLHPAIIQKTSLAPPNKVKQRNFYLPALLRRYYSESVRGSGSMADAIATCPSYPVKNNDFTLSVWGNGNNPFHYCVNTYTNTYPDNYYFGFTHAGVQDFGDWVNTYKSLPGGLDNYGPKKLSRIRMPAKEWAIAEAFRRPYTWEDSTLNNQLPRGSWPREDNSASNSGNPLPQSPYHMESGYQNHGSGKVYRGRVVTLYFDMHVEAQRGFGRYLFQIVDASTGKGFNRDEF